jgi:hypothetical protein
MDEERELAEIERHLADNDPVLAARLSSFRLPRLSLGPRSARARLTASLLMLVVVAAVSVFVYALMPFRGQTTGNTPARTGGRSSPTVSATSALGSAANGSASMRPAGTAPPTSPHTGQAKAGGSGASESPGTHGK